VTATETEVLEPDGYLQPKRYKITYKCERCGHVYHRTFKVVPRKDPPCPNKSCADKAEIEDLKKRLDNLTRMLESGQAPAHIGQNVRVKAIDTTANIVMEDYKFTNLKDRVEPGEGVAPKLPPQQQAMADNYFGGGSMKAAGLNKKQTDLLGRRAIAGAFRDMAVAPTSLRPPGSTPGESPLRVVRTEKFTKN
jgi:hypothetical protein